MPEALVGDRCLLPALHRCQRREEATDQHSTARIDAARGQKALHELLALDRKALTALLTINFLLFLVAKMLKVKSLFN